MLPKVAHLFLTAKCSNNCPKCCNNNYTVDEIPFLTKEEFSTVETVCLTGGEPFLLNNLEEIVSVLRPHVKNIYVYTSGTELLSYLAKHNFPFINGVSFSPKSRKDWDSINTLLKDVRLLKRISEGNNRLYVFLDQEDRANYTLNKFGPRLRTIEYMADALNAKLYFRVWLDEITSPDGEIFRRINLDDIKKW